jgi:hypothetical protein
VGDVKFVVAAGIWVGVVGLPVLLLIAALAPTSVCMRQECGKIVSPRRNLLWRAKLADEPPLSPWQVQRINPIAFQAAKRPWPFTVDRHHQHHQAAAVLASPRSIRLTHAPI